MQIGEEPSIPVAEMMRKLDRDFFAGRWAKATDRQRQLLTVVALVVSDRLSPEFTVQDVVDRSRDALKKGFSSSHVNQMLSSLTGSGLVYKNRHGRYLFAVPLLEKFIIRQLIDTLPDFLRNIGSIGDLTGGPSQ